MESDEKSKLLNLRCEFYNSTCVVEAKKEGSDASHCKGTQQCPTKSCYVVWKNETVSNETLQKNQTSKPNFSHESGKHVKMMGGWQAHAGLI